MRPPGRRLTVWLAALASIVTACDETASLLDPDELAGYLKLTPGQIPVVTGHIGRIVAEIEDYIRVVQSTNPGALSQEARRASVDPAVELARQETVRRIHEIALDIRAVLTPEQQEKFDRVPIPDLRASPQELEFMIARARRDTFAVLQVKPFSDIETFSLPDGGHALPYEALKEERTIVFGPGGFGSGLERFPVIVTAILADSVLVEAEFRRSIASDSLHDAAVETRRRTYYEEARVPDMLTIRMILSTFLHETYADPARWVAFVEDDAGIQYEPAETVVDSSLTTPQPSSMIPPAYRSESGMGLARKSRQCAIRFFYHDAFGYHLLRPGTRRLRLVLFDRNNPSYRTFGEWVFHRP